MDEQATRILEKFADFLGITDPITYMLRKIGWMLIKGLAWLVDSLESVTDSILFLKSFFNSSEITSLNEMLYPLVGTLAGFSFLYTGYLIIFQKKIDREAIAVNMFLALVVITLLGTGMDKANKFTDDAVSALKEEQTGTTAEQIVKSNIHDIAQFDRTGWSTPEIKHPNRIPTSGILKINITQAIDDGFQFEDKKEISPVGKIVLEKRLDYTDMGNSKLEKLENGWLTAFKEKYYRYHVNWFTVIVTLAITAFTLLTISIKLAKLFFELTFNYVLATIIAPADIHSGQKTKQVIQNILNIFLVTIMIFLSMKIYILGTAFIEETLTGLPYLIALFAFSLAVIDGPNIIERLFGIDAGLKAGWSALAGGYAGVKGTQQGFKSLSSSGKSSALKGIQGVAGVAGMAQGLRSKGQEQGQEQQKEQAKNASQGGKGDANSKTQDKDLKDTQNENGANENDNGNTASYEITTGMQQAASSLEQEMEQKQQQDKGMNGNKPQGLHQEMASKGVGNNNPNQRNITPVTASFTTPVSRSSGSSTSIPSTSGGGGSVSEQMSSHSANEKISGDNNPPSSLSPVLSTQNYQSLSDEMQEKNKPEPLLQEKRTDQETRHVGQVVFDNLGNKKTVQRVQRSYQIGQNTGEVISKNIANYRKKHRKE